MSLRKKRRKKRSRKWPRRKLKLNSNLKVKVRSVLIFMIHDSCKFSSWNLTVFPFKPKPDSVLLFSDEVKLPSVAPPKYKSRVEEEEILVLEQIFREELTEEDKTFFKTAYDQILGDYPDLLDGITWFSAPEIPSSARRRQPSSVDMRHSTGCARTEGFYRVSVSPPYFGLTGVFIFPTVVIIGLLLGFFLLQTSV